MAINTARLELRVKAFCEAEATRTHFLDRWPGKRSLGMYRFLPMFFILGAALEFSMINWKVGDISFYNTFKKRQAHSLIREKIEKITAT